MSKDKPSRLYLFIFGVTTLFVYMWAIDNLIDVPVFGFFLAWVGWLVPLALLYGAFTGE